MLPIPRRNHISIFFSRQCNFGTVQFSYRDFYKVTLIIGTGRLYYADKWILVDRPALLFSNPLVPYAWESISEEQKGLFCIFNEQFVQTEEKNGSLAYTPLFKVTGDKAFFLNDEQVEDFSLRRRRIFQLFRLTLQVN